MDFLFLFIGIAIGFVIAYFMLKAQTTSPFDTTAYDTKINNLEKQIVATETNLSNSTREKQSLADELNTTKATLKAELTSERNKYLQQLQDERDKLSKAESRIARAEEVFKSQEEKYTTLKQELENVHKKYSTEFEIIANKILDEKTEKFTTQNKTNLDTILNPLKERIKEFEEKVDKAYKAESTERTTLKAEIKNLVELNKQVSEEANNLAKALKGENKTQGNWGELILEKVLERSGLVKNQEYELQYSTTNDEGKRILPDVIIKLPDSKHIIVDSKVSLVAYELFVNAADDEARERYSKDHITSVRSHIKQLSDKNYQSSADLNTPDFVLLFIPIESSFSLAVQADNELFNFAWERKIVIVSPSTLLATLRTIASVWKQERQTKNAIEIAKQSGALYDKFVGFIEDMDKLGKSIDSSHATYESAINKLHKGNGNLVKRAQDIEKLGAKTSKSIATKFIENDDTQQLTTGLE